MKKIPQDIVGNIAILKFPRKTLWIIKKIKAFKFLKNNKSLTTVVEKTGKISGNLRIPTVKHLAGTKTYDAIYGENGCIFKFNINKTYFSPRLSNERKVIADEIANIFNKKPKIKILVLFAGIAPYSIVIGKKLKSILKTNSLDNNHPKKKEFHIFSNELNTDANISAKENILLNKLKDEITLLPGDANKLPIKLKDKFDIILMPRPNIQNTFLKTALKFSKKGTIIFYHGFGTKEKVLDEIKKECQDRIGKIKIRKAGDIGAYSFRWQATFKVINNPLK